MQGLTKCFVILVFFCDLIISGKAVCQKKNGIVSGSISIYGNHIVGIDNVCAQCFFQQGITDGGICHDKTEHGTHIRMDHTGTLAHSSKSYRLSTDLTLYSDLFFMSICGHDRLRCQRTCLQTGGQHRFQILNTFFNNIHRQLFSDHTCGCHQNGISRNAQHFARLISHAFAVSHAFFTGAGICHTAVSYNSLHKRTVLTDLSIPFHRSRFDYVGGKSSRRMTGHLAENHGHIFYICFFHSGCNTGCLKSFGSGHAAFYYLYTHPDSPTS